MVSNAKMADLLLHHAHDHKPRLGIIHNVFDSKQYLDLCSQHVEIDGKQLPHKYFEDKRDIAIGLSTDGFAPFKRRTKTAWPLIAILYNLPPEFHSKLEYVLGLGVIPGPQKPEDFDSFLWPFVKEMLRLAIGVHAYDILSDDFFALRAFLILVFGDIPAISMIMHMKGHNRLVPCRMCTIRGIC
uniref:Mitochondrial phosphate carrier protein n=1 Tax=Ganoderma boninense TaxID=34458 RepID=A0A5K1K5A4_9APHY|nr:Mitochondrial phosphate carrier protein [Ganoderma boninense]